MDLFNKKNNDTEDIQEEVQNNLSPNKPKGNFFKKKYLYGVFFLVVIFLIIVIMRDEFFSSEETENMTDKKQNEQQNTVSPDLNATYGPPTDLEANYEAEVATEEITYEQEISQEEQDRLNRLRELEQEAITALRSPTTITIGTRPPKDNQNNETVSNGNLNSSSNKKVSDYDGNRQESKKNFLMSEAAQKFYQNNFLIDSLSEFELKAGDFIPAIMLTGINSDLPTKVITAVVSENIRDSVRGNHVLIPQGTKVIGVYDSSITFGQERLLVIWQRLILPNGKSLALDNMQGVDLTGQAGITGDVNNHFATLLKGVILSSFLGSVGTINSTEKFGSDDWRTSAMQGAGEQIVSIGDRFAERALSRQPTITIRPGERFNIMVHSDLILEPYGE